MQNTIELKNFINNIKETLPQSKFFVPFLEKNILSNYRGSHSVQQDRISQAQINITLEHISKLVGNDWMQVAPTPNDVDILPNHPEFTNVQSYIELVNNLKLDERNISPSNRRSNPTQLSVKKILFMNLWMMGYLERKICNNTLCEFDDYLNRNKDVKGAIKTFYRLTDQARELLACEGELNKNYLIAKAIKEKLVLSDVKILYSLILDDDFKTINLGEISVEEYVLTLNYYNNESDNLNEALKAFKELYLNRKIWLPFLKTQLSKLDDDTKKYGKGNGYIDFGNWKNQVTTKFSFLELTSNFKRNKNGIKIVLAGIDEIDWKKSRSSEEKKKYLEMHKINSTKINNVSFELHHIIPIADANNAFELLEIDSWKNMILISPNKHSEFPKRNNDIKHISHESDCKTIWVNNLDESSIISIINREDSLYDCELVNEMIEYNNYLLLNKNKNFDSANNFQSNQIKN